MVLDRRTVERRLAELDRVLAELASMVSEADEPFSAAELRDDLARRWSLERGLLAAANLVIDVANHIGSGHFTTHPATYEEGLRLLGDRGVVAKDTYRGLKGLGGFRNVLAHEYLDIDLEEVVRWRSRLLEIVPGWITEVAAWMDRLDADAPNES